MPHWPGPARRRPAQPGARRRRSAAKPARRLTSPRGAAEEWRAAGGRGAAPARRRPGRPGARGRRTAVAAAGARRLPAAEPRCPAAEAVVITPPRRSRAARRRRPSSSPAGGGGRRHHPPRPALRPRLPLPGAPRGKGAAPRRSPWSPAAAPPRPRFSTDRFSDFRFSDVSANRSCSGVALS